MGAAMADVTPTPLMAVGEPTEGRLPSRRFDSAFALSGHWIGVILILIAWEVFARSGRVSPFLLPAFSTVLARIGADAMAGPLFLNIGLTLYRAFLGFAIAGLIGLALGVGMARSRAIAWFFDPVISIGFPMPKITFLPVIILWLGVYDVSKVTMIVLDAVFPIVTATIAGIRGIDHQLIWSARNMGARERHLIFHVLLPGALPQILTGFQVALPIALIVAIVTEMAMGGYGLGGAMIDAWRLAESPKLFAGIVEISIIGYLLVRGMALLRRRLLHWHSEGRTRG